MSIKLQSNTTINKFLTLYKRSDNTRFIGVKDIHHKINLRSHLSTSNITPYYWFPCDFYLQHECVQPYFEYNKTLS